MACILGSLSRVPEVMGGEFEKQAFGRRPGEGSAGGELAPGFEIAEIRSKRPQRIGAHAFAGEGFQRRDIVVGQKRGKLVAPIEG